MKFVKRLFYGVYSSKVIAFEKYVNFTEYCMSTKVNLNQLDIDFVLYDQ